MKDDKSEILLLAAFLLVFLLGLPLLGIITAGRPLSPYFEFPPLTRYVRHAPFSGAVFAGLTVLGLLFAAVLFLQLKKQPRPPRAAAGRVAYPWWGNIGLLLNLVSWFLAWNRFPWFAGLQAYTFLPIWLGYILVINSITLYRTGSCLLTRRTGYFIALFPMSAGFWWFFEYLNRFAQNWYYLGIEDFNRTEYIVHASLCFTTVLPSVLSTEELLGSIRRLTIPLQDSWRARWPGLRLFSCGLLLLSGAGLAGIGIWPDFLFPLLWLSPVIIILCVQHILGRPTILSPLAGGDWRPLWLPALSALVCGFFWELWNDRSYAHWEYSVPFVQTLHLFKMPVLGYMGYLPFGLECKALASIVEKTVSAAGGKPGFVNSLNS